MDDLYPNPSGVGSHLFVLDVWFVFVPAVLRFLDNTSGTRLLQVLQVLLVL
jgi:hypothetical protein